MGTAYDEADRSQRAEEALGLDLLRARRVVLVQRRVRPGEAREAAEPALPGRGGLRLCRR